MKVGLFVISAREIASIREHGVSSSLEDVGAERSRPNLIISDIGLPDGSVIDLIRLCAACPRFLRSL